MYKKSMADGKTRLRAMPMWPHKKCGGLVSRVYRAPPRRLSQSHFWWSTSTVQRDAQGVLSCEGWRVTASQ